MTRACHHQIHLIVQRRRETETPGEAEPIVVAVDESIVHLDADAQKTAQAAEDGVSVQLLPGDAPRLVIASSTRRALVNGQLVPSIAVARAGDEIALEGIDDWRLCLAVYRPAPVGRAGEECSGQECPLCLTRFTPENLVFRCGCGSVLHVGEGHGAADELDCARAAAQCPDCGRAITLESSYEGLNCGETGRQILPRDRSAAVFV